MIRKSDVEWWVLEAGNNPQAASEIIQELARRLEDLDAENEQLRNQILEIKRGAQSSTTNKTEVEALNRRVNTLKSILDGQASAEPSIVFVSHKLQTFRVPISQVRIRLREKRPVLDRSAVLGTRCILLARPHNDLIVFTSLGQLIQLPLHQIPFLAEETIWPESEGKNLAPGERVAGAVLVETPRFWTMVTQRGFVRQFLHIRLTQSPGEQLLQTNDPPENGPPVALVNGDKGDLLMCSHWGIMNRFPQHTITTRGLGGMAVEQDDKIATAIPVEPDGEILLLTASGYGMRRDVESIKRQQKPGGAGQKVIQAFDVLDVIPYAARGKLLYLTYSGNLTQADVSGIPLQTRYGKGIQVMDLGRDPAIAAVFVPGALL